MRFHLGTQGESAWSRLRAALALETRRGVALVLSEHPEALKEVKRRVQAESRLVAEIEPDGEVVTAVQSAAAFAHSEASAERGALPVAWLQAAPPSAHESLDSQWRVALSHLNLAREELGLSGPVFVILAGPPELKELLSARAPDLWSVTRPISVYGEAPQLQAGGVIQWLHFSDLHLGADGDWAQDVVLAALHRDLPRLLEEAKLSADFAILTGDVAYSGRREEYDTAIRFLTEFCESLHIEPRERLVIVPGNHDVNRAAIRRGVKNDQGAWLEKRQTDRQAFVDEVNQIVGNPQEIKDYGERLSEFCAFTAKILGAARQTSEDRLWRTDVFKIGSAEVGVASLCSAWACGPDDDAPGRIVLGEMQVRQALKEIAQCRLRVVALHHPLEWLADPERTAIQGILRSEAHLVLHGHLHEAELHSQQTPSQQLAVLAAGACYARGALLGVQAARLDLESGELALHFFTYSARDGGFWHAHAGAMKGAEQGVGTIQISSLALAPAPTGQAPADADFAARLRRQTALVEGNVTFMGIPQTSTIPKVKLADLFVPLSISMGQSVSWPTNHLIEQLRSGARVVVLGAPGSGKSTLCKYVVVQESIYTPAAPNDPPARVPILLRLRRWANEPQKRSLLAYCAQELTEHLSVLTREDQLAQLCEKGQVLLVVDGFDEVPSDGDRERVRDELQGFAGRYPNVAILATSRVVGYDNAPLTDPFVEFRLNPFNNEQLEQFAIAWYQAAEPDDPVARAERRASLLSALEQTRAAKELARNPLLATLIALVHQHYAELPGDRAKLFELVVTLLVQTWPRAHRWPFAGLDGGQQRELLERLALNIVESSASSVDRGKGRSKATLPRGEFESIVSRLLREFEYAPSNARAAELAREWVNYLAAHTGIIVEQGPGRFGFLHLSLLEYLAGKGLWARESVGGDASVAQFVVAHLGDDDWLEPLVLMMGSEATRSSLSDAVFEKLQAAVEQAEAEGKTRFESLKFAFALLLENVAFRPQQREWFLDLALDDDDFFQIARYGNYGPMHYVVEHSSRHRVGVLEWARASLGVETGKRFLALVSLAWSAPSELTATTIEPRGDCASLVPWVLEHGPQHPWARWATRRATVVTWDSEYFSLEATVYWGLVGGDRKGSVVAILNMLCALSFHHPPQPAPGAPYREAKYPMAVPAVISATPRPARVIYSRLLRSRDPESGTARSEVAAPHYFGFIHYVFRPSHSSLSARMARPESKESFLHAMGITPDSKKAAGIRLVHGSTGKAQTYFGTEWAPPVGPRRSAAEELALGLFVYQTYWRWPESASWRAHFAGPPPEPWLDAMLWHACQAAGAQDPTEHLKLARQALDRCEDPTEKKIFGDLLPIPTPAELLACFPGPLPNRVSPDYVEVQPSENAEIGSGLEGGQDRELSVEASARLDAD